MKLSIIPLMNKATFEPWRFRVHVEIRSATNIASLNKGKMFPTKTPPVGSRHLSFSWWRSNLRGDSTKKLFCHPLRTTDSLPAYGRFVYIDARCAPRGERRGRAYCGKLYSYLFSFKGKVWCCASSFAVFVVFFLIVLSNHRQFSLYIATIIYYKSDVYTTTENHVRPYLPILHGQVADSNGMYSSRLAHVKSNK